MVDWFMQHLALPLSTGSPFLPWQSMRSVRAWFNELQSTAGQIYEDELMIPTFRRCVGLEKLAVHVANS